MAVASDDNITELGQAYHALYHNVQVRRAYGYGVMSGCAVSPGDSGVSIDVTGGTVLRAGQVESVPTVDDKALDSPDSTDPRKDVVVWNGTGVEVITGTPNPVSSRQSSAVRFDTFQPAPPSTQGRDVVVLAEIWVAAGANSLTADDINVLATSPAANFSQLGLPDDQTLTFGDQDDFTARYNSATNELIIEDASTGNQFKYGADGDFTLPGDLSVGGTFDPSKVTPDEVTVGSSLELPTYADNANAVQEDAEVWFNDGSGPQAAGIYYYDAGVVGPLATGAGSSPGSLSGLGIDTDKDWAGYVLTNVGKDGVRVPSTVDLVGQDFEYGTLPDDVTVFQSGSTFEVRSSTALVGSHSLYAQCPTDGAYSSASFADVPGTVPQPGDTFTVHAYLTDSQVDAEFWFAVQQHGNFPDGYRLEFSGGGSVILRQQGGPGGSITINAGLDSHLNERVYAVVEWGLDGVFTLTAYDSNDNELGSGSQVLDRWEEGHTMYTVTANDGNQHHVFMDGPYIDRRTREYLTETDVGTTELGNEVTPSGAIHAGPHEAELNQRAPHSVIRSDPDLAGGADVAVVDDVLGADAGIHGQADGEGFGYAARSQAPLGRIARLNANLSWEYDALADVPTWGITTGSDSSWTTQLTGTPRLIQIDHDGSGSGDRASWDATAVVSRGSLGDFRVTFKDLRHTQSGSDKNYVMVGLRAGSGATNPRNDTDAIVTRIIDTQDTDTYVVSGGTETSQNSHTIDLTGGRDVTLEVTGSEVSLFVDGTHVHTCSASTDAALTPVIQSRDSGNGTTGETVDCEQVVVEVLS